MLDILQPFCAPCYCSYWLIGWHCNYCPRYDITICPGRTRNKGWLVARIKVRYYVHNNKYSESFGQYLVIFIVRVLNCCLNIVPLKHSSSLVDLAYWQFQICQRQKWLLCLLTWMLPWPKNVWFICEKCPSWETMTTCTETKRGGDHLANGPLTNLLAQHLCPIYPHNLFALCRYTPNNSCASGQRKCNNNIYCLHSESLADNMFKKYRHPFLQCWIT